MDRQHQQFNRHEYEETQGDTENSGTWGPTVHEVTKSQTQFCDGTMTLQRQNGM